MTYKRKVQVTITYAIETTSKKGMSAMMSEIRKNIPCQQVDAGDEEGIGGYVMSTEVPSRKGWKIKDIKGMVK